MHDPRDRAKQTLAATLVKSLTDGILLWQVACEYVAAGSKLKPLGVSPDEIWRNLRLLQSSWTMVLPEWRHLDRAEVLLQTHSLSIWDALLLGAALESGVSTLYSEDLVGVGKISGIHIVNPLVP